MLPSATVLSGDGRLGHGRRRRLQRPVLSPTTAPMRLDGLSDHGAGRLGRPGRRTRRPAATARTFDVQLTPARHLQDRQRHRTADGNADKLNGEHEALARHGRRSFAAAIPARRDRRARQPRQRRHRDLRHPGAPNRPRLQADRRGPRAGAGHPPERPGRRRAGDASSCCSTASRPPTSRSPGPAAATAIATSSDEIKVKTDADGTFTVDLARARHVLAERLRAATRSPALRRRAAQLPATWRRWRSCR